MNYLIIDAQQLNEMKKLYAEAVKNGDGTFKFQDGELLTEYAKYMIQFLEEKIGKANVRFISPQEGHG